MEKLIKNIEYHQKTTVVVDLDPVRVLKVKLDDLEILIRHHKDSKITDHYSIRMSQKQLDGSVMHVEFDYKNAWNFDFAQIVKLDEPTIDAKDFVPQFLEVVEELIDKNNFCELEFIKFFKFLDL